MTAAVEQEDPVDREERRGIEDDGPASTDSGPRPLSRDAYYGLAGDIVRTIEPETEADPAALLVQTLASFGNVIGKRPHVVADGAYHACKLDVAIVGATSKGRKGTSWARAKEAFELAAPDWAQGRVMSGLSSGEGLIWQIRDPIMKSRYNPKTGETELHTEDEGIDDKRLLAVSPELAATMAVMARPTNTLSAIIREAWDGSSLKALTKNSPAHSTGAHVTIIGHVSRDELRRNLARTELGNGFANRFLWIFAKRCQVKPWGGRPVDLRDHAARLSDAIEYASAVDEVTWGADARPLWEAVYPKLSDGHPGIVGAVTARAEAQVVRVAMIYALIDKSAEIRAVHLRAALEVWRYSFATARWIWGDALGDPTADELLDVLRSQPEGLTDTEIRDLFGRHKSEEVARAKQVLLTHNLVRKETERTAGRSVTRWFAVAKNGANQ